MNRFYLNLSRLMLTAVFMGSMLIAHSQSIANYEFSTNTTSSLNRTYGSLIDDIDMNTGTTLVFSGSVPSSSANHTSTVVPMPFDFFVNGVRYASAANSMWITTNGWVMINNNLATTPFNQTTNYTGARFTPFLGSDMSTSSIGRVHYKVVGSQPSRVMVIEFMNMTFPHNQFTVDSNTFQVRLYELNGAIEFVYGRMALGGSTPRSYNTGIHLGNGGSVSPYYQHVNTSTHVESFTNNTANTYSPGDIPGLCGRVPGNQRNYMWIPKPVADPIPLTATNITSSSMLLNWTNVANELGYAVYRSTDNVNYTWVTNTTLNYYNVPNTLIANTIYYWRVYAYRESVSGPAELQTQTLQATRFYTIAPGNWNTPTIWNTNAVPGAQDTAEISVGHNVTLDVTQASCGTLIVKGTLNYWAGPGNQTLTVNGDLRVETGGTINHGTGTAGITPNYFLNIGGSVPTNDIPGSLINNGTLNLEGSNSVVVTFSGSRYATISGSSAPANFELPFIVCNKGTDTTSMLEVLSRYSQSSSALTQTATNAQRLHVQTGTLKISAGVVTNSIYSTNPFLAYHNLTATNAILARLWLSHPDIRIGVVPGYTGSMNPQLIRGELLIESGELTLGTASNVFFPNTYGSIVLKGGTFTYYGGLTLQNNTNLLEVSGGNLVIDPQGANVVNTITLNIAAASGLNFSAGTITIVDPPVQNGIMSVQIAAGGNKSITGGTFVLGSSGSTSAGVSPVSATSGFAINCGIPIYNLTINNLGNTINTRYCRLATDLTVNGTLTLEDNSYLSIGNGNVPIIKLIVNGNVVNKNNAVLTPVFPGGTTRNGLLDFTGSSAQTVSGAGTASYLTTRIANPAGVTFSNTGTWAMEKITLETGNVTNTTANLQVGSTTPAYSGSIVIGGSSESVTAGSFSALPTLLNSLNYTYGPAANALVTGAFNEMPNSTQNLAMLTINDEQGLTVSGNRNINISGTLALTAGNLNMGNNALTLGTGTTIATAGTLTRGTGFVVLGSTGTFTRWFSNNTNYTGQYTQGFPLSTGVYDRSILFSTFMNAGCSLTVRHNNVLGYTDVTPFLDNVVNIDRRSNSNWTITGTAPTLYTAMNLNIVAAGIGAVTNTAMMTPVPVSGPTPLVGTQQSGSGTNAAPVLNRSFTAVQFSNLLGTAIYAGSTGAVNPLSPTITAIHTGLWSDVNTWEGGVIPTITNNALIATGVTVTIPAAYTAACNGLMVSEGATVLASNGTLNNAGSLFVDGTFTNSGSSTSLLGGAASGITVSSTGVLNVSGGTLGLGASGGSNRKALINGALNVTGGTLNINGNLEIGAGATFTQTAGDINIDGNDGSSPGSVSAVEHLLSFPGSSATIACSGGTITIVDPPYQSSSYALRINLTAGSLTAFTGTHTLVLGNGTSSTTSSNPNGFILDTKKSSGRIPLQNVVVNGGSGTNRWVSAPVLTGGLHVKGSFTVNAGSEFRHTVNSNPLALGGDITNNGTMTMAATLILGGEGYVQTNAQTIDGAGTFRNAVTGSTGAFTSLNLNNGTGLTLNTVNQTFGITGTLTLGALKITTNSNTVLIGPAGSISRTTGYVVGNLGKTFGTGNQTYTYHIGTAANYLPVDLINVSVTGAGSMAFAVHDGSHPQLAGSCIDPAKMINRYWKVTRTGLASTGGDYRFSFLSGDVLGSANLALARTFAYNGTSWTGGITGSGSTSTYTVTGLSLSGDLAVGEIIPVPTSVTISATPSGAICSGTSVQFSANIVNGGPAPAYSWKVNGVEVATTATYSSSTLSHNDEVTCDIVSNDPCVVVTGASSDTIRMSVSQPTVAGDVTGGSTICSGSQSGLLSLSGHTGAVQRWQYSVSPFSTWSDTAITTSTFTSSELTQTTRFRAVVKNGACDEAFSDTTEVLIVQPSAAPAITGPTSVCSGSSAGNLTLPVTGRIGDIIRWESATNAAFTANFNSTSTSSSTYDPGTPSQTMYYRAVVKNGSCAEAFSPTHIITVIPASVGGTLTNSSQTICAGSNVSQLAVQGKVGNVIKWESSTSPTFATVTEHLHAHDTFTPSSPATTTYYRAVVQSGSCAAANSAVATVTVRTAPGGGTISGPSAVCSGSAPGTLTLQGTYEGTIGQWEVQTTGPGWTPASTNSSYAPGVLTATTKFRVRLVNAPCPDGYSAEKTIAVDQPSVGGSVGNNQTICAGGTVTGLSLSGETGNVVKWQLSSDAAFTSPLDTAITDKTFTPASPATTTYYRAVVQNGTCSAVNSSPALITVNPAPSAGSLSNANQTICPSGITSQISVSGYSGIVTKWQSSANTSFAPVTDIPQPYDTFTPASPAGTTYYRAVITSGSCPEAYSPTATITVNPASAGGTQQTASQSICPGGNVSMLAITLYAGTVQRWESSENASFSTVTTINHAWDTLTPVSPSVTTYYRAVVKNGSCAEAYSTTATVTVNPASAGGTQQTASQSICPGGNVSMLAITLYAGTVQRWESSENASFSTVTTINHTWDTLTPVSPSVTTYYRAVVKNGSCAEAYSTTATITVNPASAGGTLNGTQTICGGESVSQLALQSGSYQGTILHWESSTSASFATVTTISHTWDTLTPASPSVTTYYRAVVKNGSCAEAYSTTATVTVNPASAGGTLNGSQTICTGGSVSQLTLQSGSYQGTILRWESSATSSFASVSNINITTDSYTPSPAPSVTTYYRAVVQNGSCNPAYSSTASITVNSAATPGTLVNTGATSVCIGNTGPGLQLTSSSGTIQKWEVAYAPDFVYSDIVGQTSATYSTGTLNRTARYRVTVGNTGCTPVVSNEVTVNVDSVSLAGSATTATTSICTGTVPAQITLSGTIRGTVTRWDSSATSPYTAFAPIPSSAGNTYTPPALSSTTYFRAVVQNGVCPAATSSDVAIVVNQGAVAGSITGTSAVCGSPATASLSVQNNTGSPAGWLQSTSPFTVWTLVPSSAGQTSISPSLSVTTRFRAFVTNTTCPNDTTPYFEVSVQGGGIWTGAVSSSWNVAGNWCGGVVPTATTNVVIPAGRPNAPLINAAATANNITVNAGATIGFISGNSISIRGNLTVEGSFNTNGGTVILSGASAQDVAGISYNNLVMNGSGAKTLTGNATVNGTLTLTNGVLNLGSSNLVLSGTLTGGSFQSYLNTNGTGTVKQLVGSGTAVFPVGNGSYTPLSISNQGTADNISVNILPHCYNSYSGFTGLTPMSGQKVVDRTFIITEDVAGGSLLDITFNWNQTDEQDPTMDKAKMVVGHYTTTWNHATPSPQDIRFPANEYQLTLSNQASLGIFGVGDATSPLPVRLLSFTARLNRGVTHLSWITASETNNSHFEVERSTDGSNFEPIADIAGKGNSGSRVDYSYDDTEAGKLLETVNIFYYRLKQYSFSGEFDYSAVISVGSFKAVRFDVVNAVPNPFNASTFVTYKTGSTTRVDYVVTDAFGRVVTSGSTMPVIGANNLEVGKDNEWKAGVYFVKITQDNVAKVVKIVKE